MVRSEKDMYEKLGFKESSNRYGADNGLGYWGRYQMGEAALTDAGYMKNGRFTGKDGVYSAADFKNNPKAQESAIRIYHKKTWNYLKKILGDEGIKDYVGTTINDIPITPSGLLIASHLVGYIKVASYLKNEGAPNYKDADYYFDGNGTHIEEYMSAFADYDVSDITKIPHKPYVLKAEMSKGIDDIKEATKKLTETKILPFNQKTVLNKINELEQKGQELLKSLKSTDEFYNVIENYTREKYKQCKNKPKGKKNKYINNELTLEKYKTTKKNGSTTGFASNINSKHNEVKQTNSSDNWSEKQHKEFLEGFNSNKFASPEKYPYRNTKPNWTDKFNIGNPETDDGHWVTLDNGKHLFIKD